VPCLSIMHSFSVTSANIAISDTSLKVASLGYISVAESIGVSSTTFTLSALKATELDEKRQSNGHYAVHSHPRSAISVPIESSYATSH